MKKTLSLLLVAIICVSAIIAFVPAVEAEAAVIYDLLFPVDNGGSVYCVYGYSQRYYNNKKFHTGLDIHAKSGGDDTIYSAAEGTITKISNSCSHVDAAREGSSSYGNCSHGYGNVVYVEAKRSDGTTYELIYAHLKQNSILVKAGQSVKKGQALATMGSSGNSTGKHLHFQVNCGGSTVNINQNAGVVNYSYSGYGCDCKKLNDYTVDGKCNSCGTYFNFEATKTDKKSIFATITKVSPSTTPYQATQDKSTTLKAGTAVEVLGKYKNAFDHVWYKVSYGNGKTGYLPDGYVREVAPTILPSYVLATATTKTEVMSLPCSTKTNSTSYEVAILSKGESFDVTQIVINTAGNYWYKVKTASGDEGWVWCEETKVKSFDKEPNTIIIGSDFPTTIPKAGRHVDYKVQTTYSNIKSVKGAIYNGTATSGTAVCSSTLDAGQKKSINLYGTSLDNALTFGSLTEGKQYTLVITANLVYGYYDYDSGNFKSYEYPVSKAWTFTVKSSSSSSCSHTYDNACDTTCNKCGATRNTSHSYTNACDTSCNTCGATRSISHSYVSDCDTSCDICGATRTAYCSSDNLVYTYFNDRKHIAECSICGKTFETLHYPGSVTQYTHFNSTQHWFYCVECGENFEYSDHDYSNSSDETCNYCDYVRVITHTYDNACDTTCNECGETRNTAHKYNGEYDTDHFEHWQYCVECHTPSEREDHIYDNDCDTLCDVCNASNSRREPAHTYSNGCDTTCNVCGATRGATSHIYNNACDTTCNVCGATRNTSHKYSNPCDKSCDVCGATRTVPDHVYDHDCDTSCNNCGYSRTTSHKYDNACDTACNVCGAERTASHSYFSYYLRDETNHWRKCSVCGYRGYLEKHTPGAAATETNPQVCIVCEFVIQAAIGHTHTFEEVYTNDGDQHWRECSGNKCNAKVDIADHVFDNSCDTACNDCGYIRAIQHSFDEGFVSKEPTTAEKGEITYTCVICGEKKHEDIDALPDDEQVSGDDQTPGDDQAPGDDQTPGGDDGEKTDENDSGITITKEDLIIIAAVSFGVATVGTVGVMSVIKGGGKKIKQKETASRRKGSEDDLSSVSDEQDEG